MTVSDPLVGPATDVTAVVSRDGLDALVSTLRGEGYRVIGPTVSDGAVVLAELDSGSRLPDGWSSRVGPGRYRLERRSDHAVFTDTTGPMSWKPFLHPPRQRLWTERDGRFAPAPQEPRPAALLGVRGCDLAAIGVLRGVLGEGAHADVTFRRRLDSSFVVAVTCTEPGATCFCTSTGTGPAPGPGFDLALTERLDGDEHRFLVAVGSAAGARVLAALPHRAAVPADVDDAVRAVAAARDGVSRALPDVDVPGRLREARDSGRWDDVGRRCLACGNCTAVCPTCFCTTTEDATDLPGETATRSLRWASCFEPDFSYLHGGSVRVSTASRYRQWLTHKFSTWHDQFGRSGCVGCGRCIAWCPAGIDLLAEVAVLAARGSDREVGPDDRS